MPRELPLVGLNEDTLLPGEERAFRAQSVPVELQKTLVAMGGEPFVVLAITSPVELPGLAAGRFGTVATVVSSTAEEVVLRGHERVRIASARGPRAPFTAELAPQAQIGEPTDLAPLLAAARALFDALANGGRPLLPLDPDRVQGALVEALRAVGEPADLKRAQDESVAAAVEGLARRLRETRDATAGAATLEAVARQTTPPLDADRMRRLWSQTVEVLRRLDVYEPGAGSEEGDLGRLQRRLVQAGLPREARDASKRELRLLRSMDTRHHDYSSYLQHLDWIARLPWHPTPLPEPDFDEVSAALEAEHHGLGKVKNRILEFLAVQQLGAARSTVLCLAGPPGVGKTTIARAIATALGRKFARVALGGIHDESELRGHRLSYVAAQPGRLVQALAAAGQANALVLLDEIDKLGSDRTRSPTGALLEILDPEQHTHFRDNYLGVPIDLSPVLFLCTANDLGSIDPILRDRLEIVELPGYTARDKANIAREHLLRRIAKDNGATEPLDLPEDVLAHVIDHYTREAGVRELQRQLGALYRARALERIRGEIRPPQVDLAEVERVLGRPRYKRAQAEAEVPPGVAMGLSVSGNGGQLLPIEVLIVPGAPQVRTTGRIGEVMQESARAAVTFLRHSAPRLGLDPARLEAEVHVHVPEGAVPKEGPSAGIALFAALLSAALGRRAQARVAMTGEITLRGRILPVGGIEAKVLAAERAGIEVVLVPEDNRADVPETRTCRVVFVRNLDEVPALVLEEE